MTMVMRVRRRDQFCPSLDCGDVVVPSFRGKSYKYAGKSTVDKYT
jgi:hypothetical protein